MNITFKNAEESDKDFFYKLYYDSMYTHIEKIWGWDQAWQEKDFIDRWSSSKNIIISLDGKMAGYIQIMEQQSENYIVMFIIDTQLRSLGIGKLALKKYHDEHADLELKARVFKINSKALLFYKKNGFLVRDEEKYFYTLSK